MYLQFIYIHIYVYISYNVSWLYSHIPQLLPAPTLPQYLNFILFFLNSPLTPNLCGSWIQSHSLEYGPPTRNHTFLKKKKDYPSPRSHQLSSFLAGGVGSRTPPYSRLICRLDWSYSGLVQCTSLSCIHTASHDEILPVLWLNVLPCTHIFYAVICQWALIGCSHLWLLWIAVLS